ncbi:lipopolysaccharide export system protein LptC [Marinobacter pelagius]|uniref:Lipopolysaccharide export system protein LptC n=1 Tax=Marinobacter pelagius TaxID=379482 RepID=A0A366GJG4_9GAMM|nr:LPS export ABC transporter periplasmic protein LptC [Marinobacter pelagius]RBP26982.1 lipopolysaccharide export system protein LptC [Marinobacter pelagius]
MNSPVEFLQQFTERPLVRALAVVALVAAALFLLWRSDEPPAPDPEAAALRGPAEPDGFVVDGAYTSYDQNGNLKVHFTSPRIEQFEEGNMATMVSPTARLFGEPGTEPWTIEANNGSLLQNENLLYLTDNVRIIRQVGEREATLTTSKLTLDNDQNIIYTDAPVEITDRIGVTRATGMKAWINDRIVELNSDVEGRYETVQ